MREARANPLPPPVDIIGGGLIQEGGVLEITGPEKVGKSHLATQLAWCVASGTDFLGFAVPEPLKVFYFQLENHPSIAEEWSLQMGRNFPESSGENFTMLSWTEWSAASDEHEHLVELTQTFKPDLFILDPLYQYHTKNENDNEASREVIRQIRSLIMPWCRAFVFVHHNAKDNQDTQFRRGSQKSSGSGVWGRWPSSIMALSGYNPLSVTVEFILRNAPPMGPVQIGLADNGVFELVDSRGAVTDELLHILEQHDGVQFNVKELFDLMVSKGVKTSERNVSAILNGRNGNDGLVAEGLVKHIKTGRLHKYQWMGDE